MLEVLLHEKLLVIPTYKEKSLHRFEWKTLYQ